MEKRKEFVLRRVAGENLLVPVGGTALTFNGLVTLNETGAFLWEKLQEGKQEEELIRAVQEEYEVSEAKAGKDIRKFLEYITEAGIL